MKIWLVRHGETRVGEDGLYKPHHGLTERGVRQADEVAAVLLKQSIDACYSSGLPRAIETMRRYTSVRGLTGVEIEALNEIDIGDIDSASPQIKRQIIEHESDLDFSQFGGENPRSFYQRVVPGWNSLCEDADNKGANSAVAFLHGGTIGVIVAYLEGKRFDYRTRPRMPNCAYLVVEVGPARSTLAWSAWETEHLSELT